MNKYPTMTIEMTYVDEDNREYTKTIEHRNVVKFVDSPKYKMYYELTVLTDDLGTYTNLASKSDLVSMVIRTSAPIKQYRSVSKVGRGVANNG